MLDLISIEYIKLKNNSSFWIILVFYMLISFYVVGKADSLPAGSDVFANPLQFPMIWLTSTYCASFLVLFPSILIILNIGNEFKYKTAKQHVIDGLSKTTFILSKFISVFDLNYKSMIGIKFTSTFNWKKNFFRQVVFIYFKVISSFQNNII